MDPFTIALAGSAVANIIPIITNAITADGRSKAKHALSNILRAETTIEQKLSDITQLMHTSGTTGAGAEKNAIAKVQAALLKEQQKLTNVKDKFHTDKQYYEEYAKEATDLGGLVSDIVSATTDSSKHKRPSTQAFYDKANFTANKIDNKIKETNKNVQEVLEKRI